VPPLLLTSSVFFRHSPLATRRFLATLCFRRHMHHMAPLSPVPSLDCPYFLSPRRCPPYALQISRRPWQTNWLALCFHTLTNPFSRNPFLFTSIQIPGEVGVSGTVHASPPTGGGRYPKGRGRRKAGTAAQGIVRAKARRPECTELQRLPRQRHYSGSYPRRALQVSGAAHGDLRLPDGDGPIEEKLAHAAGCRMS